MTPNHTRRAWTIKAMAIIISLAILTACPEMAGGQGLEEAEQHIRLVYSRLREAEGRGADVKEAALKLNDALTLIREAASEPDASKREKNLSRALTIIGEVEASIDRLIEEGEARSRMRTATLAISTSLIGLASIMAYIYAPRAFWSLWLRARRDWRVKRA